MSGFCSWRLIWSLNFLYHQRLLISLWSPGLYWKCRPSSNEITNQQPDNIKHVVHWPQSKQQRRPTLPYHYSHDATTTRIPRPQTLCVIHLNIHPNRWHSRPCLTSITSSCSSSPPWNQPCPASSGTPNTPTSLLRFATQPTPLNIGCTTHRRQKYGQSNSLAIQKNNVACHWHPTPWI